jgi:hypothetical protein
MICGFMYEKILNLKSLHCLFPASSEDEEAFYTLFQLQRKRSSNTRVYGTEGEMTTTSYVEP